MKPLVDFGAADVAAADKGKLVGKVFSAVSPYYDRMNDLMSLGMHRRWKDAAAFLADVHAGMRVLDLATGSGDMAARLAKRVGKRGLVVGGDINADMLTHAKRRLPAVATVQCDGEALPFPDRSFDRVIIAFGLRNITDRAQALAEMRRVLKTGGGAFILEFSPAAACPSLYRRYLTAGLPLLGKLAANDADSYRYLGESILRFPSPEALTAMLQDAGFGAIRCLKFAAGAVALHSGRRLH